MFSVEGAMKAQQWERAKGELRALVGIAGAYHADGAQSSEPEQWEKLEHAVEAFIKDVEDNGLHE